MEFFHSESKIDFMGQSKFTAIFSGIVLSLSLGFVFVMGLNFGLDFTGGTLLEVRLANDADVNKLRENLEGTDFSQAKITNYGSRKDVLIKIPNKNKLSNEVLAQRLEASLQGESAKVMRAEFVGSEVGSELAEQGFLAMMVAMLAILVYIAFRFEYRFALSSVLALLHDPIVILGFFAYFQIEFDLAALAAILAVIGYSLNDTIVVFDRVRENFKKMRNAKPATVINKSINQTLSRTIMTSFLTLLVVLALLLFGGDSLFSFSSALSIGVVMGTYSSIYIAGSIALALGVTKEDLLPKPKKELDEMPYYKASPQ